MRRCVCRPEFETQLQSHFLSIKLNAMKTAAVTLDEQDASKLAAVDECLKEMTSIRKNMKKTDAEIRRLQVSIRRKQTETWEIIRRVQAAF